MTVVAALLLAGCGAAADGSAGEDEQGGGGQIQGSAGGDEAGSAGDAAAAELAELYAAAQEAGEGSVSVYTRANAADYADPGSGLGYVAAQFHEQFPEVSVEWSGFLDNSIFAQLDGQAASGNYTNDVLLMPLSGGVLHHQVEGDQLASFAPVSAEMIGAADRDEQDRFLVPYGLGYGLLYNTAMYEVDELPATLDELLTPQWQEQFGLVTPNGSWPADFILAALHEAGELSNEEYVDLLDNAELFQDNASALTAVAQGRTGVLLWAPNVVGLNMARTGAPVAVAEDFDTQYLQRYGVGVSANAPNPNAARLFQAWLFTPEAQAALAEGWFAYGLMPEAPSPQNGPALSALTVQQLPLDQEPTITQEFYEQVTTTVLQEVNP